ncbi:F-box protein At3g07870-like [Papaver somniferum]|uniref:F-box protein At3g07870-like n=1 Tax=Papaver somniferum TaxID=3469 RepID=UPI000E6FC18B|nr:F-box protein At3g07870-like [Papaver somniferum]
MELQRYEDLRLTEEGRRQIESGEYFEDRKSSVEFKIINHPLIKKHSGTGAIVGSCNGLVCISIPYTHHIDDPIYICNPTLGEQITLPRFTLMVKNKNNVEYKKTTYLDGHLVSGFGYNTKTDEYKVVRIHYFVSRRSELSKGQVQVYTLGSGSGWRNKEDISYSLQRYYRCPTACLNRMRFSYNHVEEICSPWRGILADGALHWLDEEWNIVAFELAEEEFSLLPSPPCFRPGVVNFFTLQVLEERLCVAKGHDGDQLDIWSFKKETSEWENMFSLSCHSDELMDMYWPISLTLGGKLLLRSNYETLICYDPQTKEFKKQIDLITSSLFEPLHHDYPLIEAIPHMNSLVSLKALGEKPKAMTRDSDLGDHFYEYGSE